MLAIPVQSSHRLVLIDAQTITVQVVAPKLGRQVRGIGDTNEDRN